jgi:NAD(P)-dependent dehydrogenase (short-subunit alcohol dehydrogenase family)
MTSDFSLANKVAVVTGGNRGIGLGIARGLAKAGSDVVIWGRDRARNAEAEAELSAFGTRIFSRTVDVSDERQVIDAMADCLSTMGRIDTVVANAGVSAKWSEPWEYPTEEYRKLLAVNLDGVFWTMREGGKAMMERAGSDDAGGSIIVVSSGAGKRGASKLAPYSASKSAVLGLTRSMAIDFGPHAIRVNSIMPGFTMTEMLGGADIPALEDLYLPRIPLRRFAHEDELGGIAVYLASNASRYHTGDAIAVDGGLSC